jgi:selenocysteine-specific elongation factor
MDVIVGTAGHIDHGKTALVKALTGIDADRLPEEKQRGITIDLGFAEMDCGDARIGFVDVPGHERFVKNMLAGASGVDLVMLVIAADEGVMPQTREHFDICRLLRIESGVVAITKTDLADADTLELARLDAAELVGGSFLEGAPVFEVSSRSGTGIEELKTGLARAAVGLRRETSTQEARLPIDRSFSVKGFGAVVTGTLTSGEIAEGAELELLPSGRRIRVRGVQTHGKTVSSAHAGQRTAVNLAGINCEDITRGMTLAAPGSLVATQAADVEIEVLAGAALPIRSRQRVRVHIGSAEVLGRVSVLNDDQRIEPNARSFAQLRLESPIAAAVGDRFIIRSYSPQRTIAGGRILDPMAVRHRRNQIGTVTGTLTELAAGADGDDNLAEVLIRMAGDRGIATAELGSRTAFCADALKRQVDDALSDGRVVDAGGVFVTRSAFDARQAAALKAIERHHREDKLSRGLPRETLREQVFRHAKPEIFRAVGAALESAGKIAFDQDVIRLATHSTDLSDTEQLMSDRLRAIYENAGLEPPKLDDALEQAAVESKLDRKSARKNFQLLVNSGDLVAVTPEFYFPAPVLEELKGKLRASGDATIDVARFKTIAGVSRKYAIPLLEHFDRTRVTRRVGDKREIL